MSVNCINTLAGMEMPSTSDWALPMLGEIKNQFGERLDYTFHSASKESNTIVVLGHGVTGNKDRAFLVALAEELAKGGVSVVRFSFSGNGASGGRFVDSTISKEVDDLGAVIESLEDYGRIGYIGHSMGGAVGVLRAARDSRIKFLGSLAGMVNTKDFAEREFGMVKPGAGFMWDDSNCPLSQAYMDDLRKIGSVAGEASKIRAPWLLVHGVEDDVVPITDSREIFARANEPKELVEIAGCNHVFAGEGAGKMIERVRAWIATLR